MASPVNDAYSVASGVSLYAGLFAPGSGALSGSILLNSVDASGGLGFNSQTLSGEALLSGIGTDGGFTGVTTLPSWITSATIGRWGIVPATNRITDLNPNANPALNPNYPSTGPWSTQHGSVTGAWNSMATDPVGKLWIWGGGHADWGGNEPYLLDLRAASPAWVMHRPPSGALTSTPAATNVPIDGTPAGIAESATGFFNDGRPRPTHTYGSMVFVPGKGMTLTNLLYCWPHVNGPQKAVYYDEGATDWGLLSDYTGLGDATQPGVGSCYDSSRNCVWFFSQGTYNLCKIDVATGVTTRHGSINNWVESALTLRYDPELDLVYSLSSGYYSPEFRRVVVFDPVTNTIHVPAAFTGTIPSGYDGDYGNGAAWDQVGARFLCWNGSTTDRTQLITITRPANPRTDAWTRGLLTIDSGNAAVPPTAHVTGTYSRFDYVPELGICALVNRTTDDVYYFKVR